MARTDAPCRACRYQYFLLPFYYRGQPPYGREIIIAHDDPASGLSRFPHGNKGLAGAALRFDHIGEIFEFHVL